MRYRDSHYRKSRHKIARIDRRAYRKLAALAELSDIAFETLCERLERGESLEELAAAVNRRAEQKKNSVSSLDTEKIS